MSVARRLRLENTSGGSTVMWLLLKSLFRCVFHCRVKEEETIIQPRFYINKLAMDIFVPKDLLQIILTALLKI